MQSSNSSYLYKLTTVKKDAVVKLIIWQLYNLVSWLRVL